MTQQSKSRLLGYLTLATMLLFLLGGTLYLQGAGAPRYPGLYCRLVAGA